MPGKIFVSYRRDDERAVAARVRDRLAQAFGAANVFMDVDNLLAGQRFDTELEKALAQTDVFLAVIGPRWMELLNERQASGERDYVREEIAGALKRGVVVIPVLIERTPLPRADALPDDIRELVLHQKHVVAHEQFGRDVAGLVEAIRFARKRETRAGSRLRYVMLGGLAVATIVGGGLVAWVGPALMGLGDALRQSERAVKTQEAEAARVAAAEKARQEEAERQRLTLLDEQERERKRAEAEASRKGAEAAAATQAGRVFRDCAECPEMVVVPVGSFLMGSPASEEGRFDNEGAQRWVTIGRPFTVGKYEVTFAEWDACVAAGGCKHNPSDQSWGRGRRPVINVSWNDITQEYIPWLSRKTGKTYRLLSEAEWEYAARAGTTTPFSTGRTITPEQANFEGTVTYGGSAKGVYRRKTVDVGSFQPNAFGLYDMHGNVWEWVEDCWHGSYAGAPTDGSAWTTSCSEMWRVLRGGSWIDIPKTLRSADRVGYPPGIRSGNFGFRLARTLSP